MDRRRSNFLRYLSTILFGLWVTFVVAYYYVIHKPWWDQLSLAPVNALIDVSLAIALVSLAGGLGHRIIPRLDGVNPLEQIGLELAIGLGILGVGILVVGLVGLISAWLAWSVLITGLIVLRKDVGKWLSRWRSIKCNENRLGQIAKFFVWLLFGLNLINALGPPLKWDSLVYHLQVPYRYVSAGRIFFYPENLYAGFPQLAGMLYTWAIALRSVTTATTLAWAVAVVMFVSMDGYARRILGNRVAWLAPAFLLTGFSVSQAMHWGYVDLWVMFYGLLMLICLDHYLESDLHRWLIFAGIMIGLAISIKYTSGILLIVGCIVILPLWSGRSRREVSSNGLRDEVEPNWTVTIKNILLNWVILGGAALVIVLPWLIKNTIMAGNPFYPVTLMNTSPDPWRQTFISGANAERSISKDLLLPIEVTFYGIEGALVEGKLEYGANVGPLMLAFAPGLILGWKYLKDKQRAHLIPLLVAGGSTWVLWSISSHVAKELMWPRHYYGIFPAVTILAVAGFDSVARITINQIRMSRILGAIIILTFVLSAYAELVVFAERNTLSVLTGRQSMHDYLAQELGWYGVMIMDLNSLPENSKILFLWEPRTLYCQNVDCYPDGTLHNWWYLRTVSGDASLIQRTLCEKEITHVLINDLGLRVVMDLPSNYIQKDWLVLDQFKRDRRVDLISSYGDSYSLYKTNCVEPAS